jgi:Leucine-rich repeat (LRR) protein
MTMVYDPCQGCFLVALFLLLTRCSSDAEAHSDMGGGACFAADLTWSWRSQYSVNIPLHCTDLIIAGGEYLGNKQAAVALSRALVFSPQITSLHISATGISSCGFEAVVSALRDTKLTSFAVSADHLGDAGASALASVLGDLELSTLALHDTGISTSGAVAIAEAFIADSRSGGGIEWLSLSGNKIGDGGGLALASAMTSMPHLMELSLSDCALTDLTAEALAAALVVDKPEELKALILSHNDGVTERGAASLLGAVQRSDGTLKTLELGPDYTERLAVLLSRDAAARRRAAETAPSKKSKQGVCTGKDLRWVGTICLLPARCVKLSLLGDDLAPKGVDGVKALATALLSREALVAEDKRAGLGDPSILKELDLSGCNISAQGMAFLARALPDSKIERLILSSNRIGDEGAKELARALTAAPTEGATSSKQPRSRWGERLVELALDDNDISSRGMYSIARALGGYGGIDEHDWSIHNQTPSSISPSLAERCPRVFPSPRPLELFPAKALEILRVRNLSI